MSLSIEHHHLMAPVLGVFAGERQRAAQQGTVLFYHGLGSSKDQQHKELCSLAERGFLAIGVDNIGHGERRYADFDWRFSGANPHAERALLEAVAQTALEVPKLVQALIEAGWVQSDKLGLVGVSMGGYIAYAAALQEPRLKAVSVILGSPEWWEAELPAELSGVTSPHLHPERFFPTALLSQNAGQDSSVPPHFARQFHQQLVAHYHPAPERQAYCEYPESGHFMREADWEACWENNLRWLERYLQASDSHTPA